MKRIIIFTCCLAICATVLFKGRIREGPFFQSISSFLHLMDELERMANSSVCEQSGGLAQLFFYREENRPALDNFKEVTSVVEVEDASPAESAQPLPQRGWDGAAFDHFGKVASTVGTNHASRMIASQSFPRLEWDGALLNRLGEIAQGVWANSFEAAPPEQLLVMASQPLPQRGWDGAAFDYFGKVASTVGTNHASWMIAPQSFPRLEWDGALLNRLGEIAQEVWANSFEAAPSEQLLVMASEPLPQRGWDGAALDYLRKFASNFGTNHASWAVVPQPFPRLEWNGALLDRLGEIAQEVWANSFQAVLAEQMLAIIPESAPAETGILETQPSALWQELANNSDTVPMQQLRRVNPYPIPKRIDISHIEGKGIGYGFGYTKLAVILGPEYQVGKFLPLASVSGQVFDDGKVASSVGFIGRFLPSSLCEIFGFNVSYDFRQGRIGNYNQISGGVEVLNKRWEVHANARVPVGLRQHTRKTVFDDYIGDFKAIRFENEFAVYAVDAKFGYYLINGKNFQLYAAAGPYYLFGQFRTSILGGQAMLRPQYKDWLYVELTVSHDRVLETIYQVNVVLSIPLYKFSSAMKNKKGACGMSNRQIYQPIDPDIVLRKKCCWHANFGQTCIE